MVKPGVSIVSICIYAESFLFIFKPHGTPQQVQVLSFVKFQNFLSGLKFCDFVVLSLLSESKSKVLLILNSYSTGYLNLLIFVIRKLQQANRWFRRFPCNVS